MGKSNANISRNIYDEAKRYQLLVHQQGVPWVEADENDRNRISYNLLRRFIQKVIGNGSPDNGFKIVGTGASNDFTITGGTGTIEGAGRLLVEGFQCLLPESRSYRGADNLECTPVSTGLSETVLTDGAANFILGGPDNNLVGRGLVPDISQPDKTYTITANTQTSITVSGNMLSDGIQVGAHYRAELSTPTAARTDEVYIDCYLDEIDSNEDPELKHTLGIQIETQRRLKLIQNVLVAEGSITPTPYTDSDGNNHYTLKLATIKRYAGQNIINAQDITDERPILGGNFWDLWQEVVAARGAMPSLDERLDVSLNEDGTLKAGHADLADMPDTGGVNPDHDARYVKKSGDTMTGNLGMASGKTVDGRDVSQDGAKLDGIEENATQDQTPQEILTALKTVDGPSSGLDADLLDGLHASGYVKKSGDTMTGNLGMASGKTVDGRDVSQDGAKLDGIENNATQDQTPQEILTALKTVDGHNSGLDADTLDGKHGSDIPFLQLLKQGSFTKTHRAQSGGMNGQETSSSWNNVYINTNLSGEGIIVFSYYVNVTWTKESGHEGHLVINYHKHKWNVREESYVNWSSGSSGNVSRKLAFDGQIWAFVSNPTYAHNDYVDFTITVNYKIYQLNTA